MSAHRFRRFAGSFASAFAVSIRHGLDGTLRELKECVVLFRVQDLVDELNPLDQS